MGHGDEKIGKHWPTVLLYWSSLGERFLALIIQ